MIKEACAQAVKLWDDENQLIKAMEECGELTQAIAKYLLFMSPENKSKMDITYGEIVIKLFEEICDVEIMIEQIKFIFISHKEVYDITRGEKLRNLERELEITRQELAK